MSPKVWTPEHGREKMGSYWAEEYATSQLRCRIMCTVNKFLLAYVILFKHVNFQQYLPAHVKECLIAAIC